MKERIHTDEVYIKVKGEAYRPITSIDRKTKYDLALTFTKHRTKQKCKEHFKKLYGKIGEQVKNHLGARAEKTS